LKEIQKEFPAMRNEKLIYDMFAKAVEWETKRSQFILWNKIIWINDHSTEIYTKRLANNRLSLIWLDPLYPEIIENPYKHLDRLQDNNSEKTNFFESTVTNYTQSSSMKGSREF
jgi:ribonucleoside-diphosphate reductase beta chain